MAGIRKRLSYANVMATLDLFVALGGGAYALTRGEVKSKHIARDAVKAKTIPTPRFDARWRQANSGARATLA